MTATAYLLERSLRPGVTAVLTTQTGHGPVLAIHEPVVSLRSRWSVRDTAGNILATIGRVHSLHVRYAITWQGTSFTLGRHLGGRWDMVADGDAGPEWWIRGSHLEHDHVLGRGDDILATLHRRWLGLRDRTVVHIAADTDPSLVAAVCAVLHDDARRRVVGGGFVGGS